MNKFLLPLLVFVFLAGASTASAASFPNPGDPTVVIPTSVGGITPNMPQAKARTAWGYGRGECTKIGRSAGCEYGDHRTSSGFATITFLNGKVRSVYVYGGKIGGKERTIAAAPLLRIETSSGVGIGSTYAALKRAAPKGRVEGGAGSDFFRYSVAGRGSQRMGFVLVGGKVWSFGIDVEA
jgi:hypothetical protein